MKRIYLLLLALLLLAAPATAALAQSGGDFELSWFTVDTGGATFSMGGDFTLGGTVGQPDPIVSSGGDFTVEGGFWRCPAAAALTGVSVSRISGPPQKVQLTWSASGQFDVWASKSPYFNPYDSGSERIGINVTSPFETDRGIGSTGENWYFVVVIVNACGISGPSNRTGEFDFPLVPGS